MHLLSEEPVISTLAPVFILFLLTHVQLDVVHFLPCRDQLLYLWVVVVVEHLLAFVFFFDVVLRSVTGFVVLVESFFGPFDFELKLGLTVLL